MNANRIPSIQTLRDACVRRGPCLRLVASALAAAGMAWFASPLRADALLLCPCACPNELQPPDVSEYLTTDDAPTGYV